MEIIGAAEYHNQVSIRFHPLGTRSHILGIPYAAACNAGTSHTVVMNDSYRLFTAEKPHKSGAFVSGCMILGYAVTQEVNCEMG